jgi:hypothetical protein
MKDGKPATDKPNTIPLRMRQNTFRKITKISTVNRYISLDRIFEVQGTALSTEMNGNRKFNMRVTYKAFGVWTITVSRHPRSA